MSEIIPKRVEDSMVETVHLVRPTHLNSAGRLFGGVLMQWIDEAAGIVAKRHCMSNITTASVDNLRFIRGAYQNDPGENDLYRTHIHGNQGRYLCGGSDRHAPADQPCLFYGSGAGRK